MDAPRRGRGNHQRGAGGQASADRRRTRGRCPLASPRRTHSEWISSEPAKFGTDLDVRRGRTGARPGARGPRRRRARGIRRSRSRTGGLAVGGSRLVADSHQHRFGTSAPSSRSVGCAVPRCGSRSRDRRSPGQRRMGGTVTTSSTCPSSSRCTVMRAADRKRSSTSGWISNHSRTSESASGGASSRRSFPRNRRTL